MDALARNFEEHGPAVVRILRAESPVDYCRLIGSLVPKELDLEVTNRQAELLQWMGWVVESSPYIAQAMAPKPERIAEKAPDPLAHLSRPEPQPRLRHEPFNASEAAAREPVADKPRLQITPEESEKF